MSTPSRNYIIQRATDTHPCMVVIRDDITEPWEWLEMTAVLFKGKLDAANALLETESEESVDTAEARGLRDEDLNSLRAKMRSYLKLGKLKYRNDPARMRLLKPLVVKSDGIQRALKLALDVEKAWEQIDATYVPETGNTFAAFGTLRAACKTKFENVSKEGAEESEAGGDLSKALKELYRLSVDWYQEAIRRFGPETPHGIMIREQIDTGGNGALHLPGKAVISSITYDNGPAIEYDAPDAETFDVWERILPEADFTKVASDVTAKTYAHTDIHADFEFKVQGRNDDGAGDMSDVASISG